VPVNTHYRKALLPYFLQPLRPTGSSMVRRAVINSYRSDSGLISPNQTSAQQTGRIASGYAVIQELGGQQMPAPVNFQVPDVVPDWIANTSVSTR